LHTVNETETETGVLCLICIIHKMTLQTETARIRSRRMLRAEIGGQVPFSTRKLKGESKLKVFVMNMKPENFHVQALI